METYFVPSPPEIAADCATIRAGWSARERVMRLRGAQGTKLARMLNLCRRRRLERRSSHDGRPD